MILSYRGYGTTKRVFLKGHVLDDRRLYEAEQGDRKRKNFMAMISRYMADPIPDIRVKVHFMEQERVVTTDERGYFEVTMDFTTPLQHTGWMEATYEVMDQIVEEQEPLVSVNEVFIMDPASRFGIISDVDDTILVSHATNIFRKIRLILTKNAKTRSPFEGVASFYQVLHEDSPPNPIFYVSSSEWNLYDFLVDFCATQEIPKGPFLLQELKTGLWELISSGGGTHMHKEDKIRHLMEIFKELPFILIGDSGQKDAFIYSEVISEFPERIIAAYIRDVSQKRKDEKILQIANKLENVEMLLVKDSADAAEHAVRHGLITRDDKARVTRQRDEDQRAG